MVKCTNCGAKSESGASFCTNCGEKIKPAQNTNCSECGQKLAKDDLFCSNCGAKASTSASSQSVKTKKAPTRKARKKTAPRQQPKKKRSALARIFNFLAIVVLVLFGIYLIPEEWLESEDDYPYDPVSSETYAPPSSPREVRLPSIAKTVVPEPFELITETISPAGAQISVGALEVEVPRDAVYGEQEMEIKKIIGTLPRGKASNARTFEAVKIGTPYDIGPDGIRFDRPITFSMAYDPAQVPQEVPASNLILSCFDGMKWVPIDAVHDRSKHTFSAAASEFPGSMFVILGTAFVVTGGTYVIATDKHKRLYQLIWDPIRRGWIHEMIKPKEKSVVEYSKRLRINDGGDLISMNDMGKFESSLEKMIKKNPTIPFGFVDKHNKKKFIELTGRYSSEADFVQQPEDYIKKVDKSGKFGDCIDVTNIYVSMLRAKGIQAKGVAGYTNDGKGNFTQEHAWVEVVIGTEVYVIDEYARLSKRADYTRFVKYPDASDSYRKMWDEKGTATYQKDWYKPALRIVPPAEKVHAQDDKKHTFVVKALGIPRHATFSWNLNNVGYSMPSRKKTFSKKFYATGTVPLACKAKWDGKELTKTITFTVHGKEEITANIKSCQSRHFHLSTSDEDVDFILRTKGEVFAEAERYMGKSLKPLQKQDILEQREADFKNLKSYYRKLLPGLCYQAVRNKDLFIIWDGVHIDHRKGKRSVYYKGYRSKKDLQKDDDEMPTGTNPYNDYRK